MNSIAYDSMSDLISGIGYACREIDLGEEVRRISGRALEKDVNRYPGQGLIDAYRDMGFVSNPAMPGFDMCRLLEERVGNCVEISALSILIGKYLGWDICAKRVPNHMYVHLCIKNRHADLEVLSFDRPMCDDDGYARK